MENKYLAYSQVFLLPECGKVNTRESCHTSVFEPVTKLTFKVPVMPANMKCCIDEKLAKWMSENEYFYSMHRFGDTFEFVKTANAENWRFISISIGVKGADKELIKKIVGSRLKVHCVTVDIAHGHSTMMNEMLDFLNNILPLEVLVVAGNVCTPQACVDLYHWGADFVKVGIAQGGACTTYGKTGFGTPMFTTVLECAKTGVPIIADGGIKTNGDIAKALVAGAQLVMAGSMFAACIDSPGENIYPLHELSMSCKDKNYKPIPIQKKYFGSASAENKKTSGQEVKNIEGRTITLDCNGMTVEEKFIEIRQDLQSSISYAGGTSLTDLKNVKYGVL